MIYVKFISTYYSFAWHHTDTSSMIVSINCKLDGLDNSNFSVDYCRGACSLTRILFLPRYNNEREVYRSYKGRTISDGRQATSEVTSQLLGWTILFVFNSYLIYFLRLRARA